MNQPVISLDQNAVRVEIERQIAATAMGNYATMNHSDKLLTTIESIGDSTLRTELLHKYLDTLMEHQSEKNRALRMEVLSKIKINEQLVSNEIEKDKIRTGIFNNRALIIFRWCFPIAAGFASIKFLDSFAFAIFIIIVLYGVLIALYFSQSNGLAETWKAITKKRRDL